MTQQHDFISEKGHDADTTPMPDTPGERDTTPEDPGSASLAAPEAACAAASSPCDVHTAPSAAPHRDVQADVQAGAQADTQTGRQTGTQAAASACTGCALLGAAGTTLLERLVAALTPRPFCKRHPLLFWGGITLLLALGIGGIMAAQDDGMGSGPAFAVVRVEGAIMDTRPLLGWIAKIRKNDAIKGVLLRIDSPGGGAAASQELHDALKALDAQKPVIASMGSTAASGGLMVAMAAREIVANASTVTGSIGVRMDIPQLQGLLDKIGVNKETLTTGRYKDAGSPTRPLSAEERAYFDRVLQDMHSQFVAMVAQGRKLPEEKVRAIADGRIMTGREALEHKLIDALGGQDAALTRLSRATGQPRTTRLVEMPKKTDLMREILEGMLGLDLSGKSLAPAFLFAY